MAKKVAIALVIALIALLAWVMFRASDITIVMLVPAGYVWTVIPVERRNEYMGALEQASSFANIGSLASFIAELAQAQSKEPLPRPR